MLVDVKCVQKPSLTRTYAWQLLGYLLADSDDQHEIMSVGWYFARQGYLWSFSVDEFLTRLSGRPTRLQDARDAFAKVCAEVTPKRRAPATPEPGTVQRAVQLFPSMTGRGKWHITVNQVPWILHGMYPPEDQYAPACGTAVTLDRDAEPLVPIVGSTQSDSSDRACRKCLLYSEKFFEQVPDWT